MRLGECLLQADTRLLRDIAANYGLECSLYSKNELITTILQTFRNASFVQTAFEGIHDQGVREACIQLALHQRGEFSQEDIQAIAQRARTRFPNKKPLLPRLLQQGWVYRVGARQSLYNYVIPEEIRSIMRTALSGSMLAQVETASVAPVIWREEAGAMIRDIALFLRQCETGIKMTVDGTIYKKQFVQLMELMEVQESPLSGTGWRFGYGRRFHQYPDRFAFIYDYCFMRSLIEEDELTGVLRLTQAGQVWSDQTQEEKQADLLRVYRILYRRPIPRLGFITAAIQTICQDHWVTADSLKKVIKPYLQPYYFDDEDALFERRILAMLIHLGILAHGSLASGVHVIRVVPDHSVEINELAEDETPAKEPDAQLFIQPNFEVLVPKDSVDAFCTDLEDMADLHRVDVMRIYRITKQTVVRAIRAGWTDSALLDFLERASKGLVPVNVKRMIQSWMGEYGKVTLYKTAVMECKTPEVAEEISQLPGIKNEIWGRIGNRHLLIREEAYEHVSNTLEQLGYMPDVW